MKVKSVVLEAPSEGSFEAKIHGTTTEVTYGCKHGLHIQRYSSGWICRGAGCVCKCCDLWYCYVDEPDWEHLKPIGPPPKTLRDPVPWPTIELCSFCVDK